ncbi:MAG TPA: 4Fe-4S dicluster domain-containing protein [Bacteroidales bacterium]|jgi:heterodisulfide reductase subunit C|nr:4Fe-4S dicluster domain-containing protein [Bacteroidales bacterium]
MEKFGFSLQKARVINYDSNDRSIVDYVIGREPSLKLCIECGGCSATCTTGMFTHFSLREMNILLKRGENKEVRNKIKQCMLCGKCILVCPRGVNTRNVVFLAKQAFQKYSTHAV